MESSELFVAIKVVTGSGQGQGQVNIEYRQTGPEQEIKPGG